MRCLVGAVFTWAAAAGAAVPSWEYEVRPSADLKSLAIEARFPAGVGTELSVDDGAEPFVHDVAVEMDGGWSPVAARDTSWFITRCAAGCSVHYRFELRALAERANDADAAEVDGAVTATAPAAWLLRPLSGAGDSKVHLRVTPPSGTRFAIGWPLVAGSPDTYAARATDIAFAPYAAFGPLETQDLTLGDRSVRVAFAPQARTVPRVATLAWIASSAEAVRRYVGRFPVDHALVLVLPGHGERINGRTLGSGGATVLLWLGDPSEKDMSEDWVLVHELSHLLLPSVPRRHHWMEEGLATYVEPLARLRIGEVDAAEAWGGMLWGFPKGLPGWGDEGLDNTESWGRTYWGGALFWFLADVRIRTRTHNRCALEDALRGIDEAGGNLGERWPVAEILRLGDRATGGHELQEVYAELAPQKGHLDLKALLKDLGVSARDHQVLTNDTAPLASVREGITSGAPSKCDAKPDAGGR